MASELLQFFKQIGFSGLIDILLMSLLIYGLLIWIKHKKAILVLAGILIAGLVYLLARQFHLILISSVLQAFFAIILIAIVVIFQEEIRSIFEQIAVWSLNRNFNIKEWTSIKSEEEDILVNTIQDLAKDRIGALIILKGKDTVQRLLAGGVSLNGELSEPLLKSIFDPNSIGHDGAVYIEGNKVNKFGCYLPLSKNYTKLNKVGTRHAAALGLSEMCDALCLVVSEEKGTISIAHNGELQKLKKVSEIKQRLARFYADMKPATNENVWKVVLKKNYREKLAAIAISLSLWFVLVYQSDLTHKTFMIPIEYPELQNKNIEKIEPQKIAVTLSGPRNTFIFINQNDIRLSLKTPNLKIGKQTIKISESNISLPKNFVLENIEPRYVRVEIADKEDTTNSK